MQGVLGLVVRSGMAAWTICDGTMHHGPPRYEQEHMMLRNSLRASILGGLG